MSIQTVPPAAPAAVSTGAVGVRGRLLATSGTLPRVLAARSSTVALDADWTLAAGSGITLNEITNADDALLMPWERPDGATIGLLVQSEVDGELRGEVFVPWGGSGSHWQNGPGYGTQGLRFFGPPVGSTTPAPQWLTIVSGQFPSPLNATLSGSWRVALTGGGYILPPDSIVRVYLARVG